MDSALAAFFKMVTIEVVYLTLSGFDETWYLGTLDYPGKYDTQLAMYISKVWICNYE